MKVPLWGGILGDIVGFSSFGGLSAPMKLKVLRVNNVHPALIQIFMSVTIVTFCPIALIFQTFKWSWYGVWTAILWTPMSIASIYAINYAGISVSQGVWSGGTVVVSFAWGYFLFHEIPNNPPLAILALIMIVIGLFGISFADIDINFKKICSKLRISNLMGLKIHTCSDENDEASEEGGVTSEDDVSSIDSKGHMDITFAEDDSLIINENGNGDNEKTNGLPRMLSEEWNVKTRKKMKRKEFVFTLIGLCCALAVALLNGTLMIFAKMGEKDFNIVISFGICQFLFSFTIIMCMFLWSTVIYGKPPFGRKQVLLAISPGAISGILWEIGNFATLFAVYSELGLTVGMPIIQVCLIPSGLIGFTFFGELRSFKPEKNAKFEKRGWINTYKIKLLLKNIYRRKFLQFFLFTVTFLIPGFFLLGFFGTPAHSSVKN